MKKKNKRLRKGRVFGLIFIIIGGIIFVNSIINQNQINPNSVFVANICCDKQLSSLENIAITQDIVITQNVPIPENIKLKMEQERLEKEKQERIAQEKAEQERLQKEAEEKAKKEAEEKKIASSKQVTSRGETTRTTDTKAEYQAYAKQKCKEYGWSDNDFNCLVKIVDHESSWNVTAKNKSSGAYGLFQALPASKMSSAGSDYLTNYKTQINWGCSYIKNRYGTPTKAWSFWQQHKWY